MNLLFAIKSLNVVGGGAERVLVDVANGLTGRGHSVRVLTFDKPGQVPFYALHPQVQRIDTGIGEPGQPTPRTGFLRAIPAIRRAVVEARADLVVAFMHSTYVPMAAALLGTGVPLVFSEHIDAKHYATRHLQRWLVGLAERLAIAKTVPSAPLYEEHPPGRRDHVHVLPNAVDVEAFAPGLHTAPQQPPVLLSVGRFMAQKNHHELLLAFARVAPRFPQWTLKIVGEGELRPQLEAQVASLGLQDRVALPGVTRDVAAEYAAASFVVLPSLYESFGLVAAEALASARPVLAFDCCIGIAEMVRTENNGLLIPAEGDRVGQLAAGLERLMGDAGLRARLGAAGPASVARYAKQGVLDEWEGLFANYKEKERCMEKPKGNRDDATIASFGDEWTKFSQEDLEPAEHERLFQAYFGIFPWSSLTGEAQGFDMGCGSGRWARLVAPRVGRLHCIDASDAALTVARRNLVSCTNVSFHVATTDTAPLAPASCDFGYSLGVLHHIPDTAGALADCVRLLKPGAPFLVYLYYRFDNRPLWFRGLWQASNVLRQGISRLPSGPKHLATDAIALTVYWPLSRLARVMEKVGLPVASVPLSYYRNTSVGTLRTDSRDRFGTPLEQRFTRPEIESMMQQAGLEKIEFSPQEPYWCAVGRKRFP